VRSQHQLLTASIEHRVQQAMTSPANIITLTTDFGLQDNYVAQMKGSILSINPAVLIVDLTHQIPAQNIAAAAFQLTTAIHSFPTHTVHLVVVDPGVGSSRNIIAVEADGQRFVCPDNGLLTSVLNTSANCQAVHASDRRWFRKSVSHVFHGRDIMAPVAAHWTTGVDITAFGPALPTESLVRLPLQQHESCQGQQDRPFIRAFVIHVDRFGNAVTCLHKADAPLPGHAVLPGRSQPVPLVTHYAQSVSTELVALFGSSDLLELAVPNGNAARQFQLEVGSTVEWHF
jgi:S-adenosylmethionine hydrolase